MLLDDYIDFIRPFVRGRGVRAAVAVPSQQNLTLALASAEAFRLAIDALPVGRDIRSRLAAHLDAHIATIRAIGAAS